MPSEQLRLLSPNLLLEYEEESGQWLKASHPACNTYLKHWTQAEIVVIL